MMLENYNVNNEMQYQKLSAEEQQQRGILGRLVGIIADFKNATRNGRRYTEELWDKAFKNPIMMEKFENRCLFGELGHPVDRQEVDMEKVCICMAEPPKKGNDGKLYGVFDILNTPNGRILKTFCDYGTRIGVSSRGSGDTFEDMNGEETVEADTYDLECWDAVLLPAVKAARPAYVTESLDTSKKTLRRALQEALDCSSEDEQKIMKETLDSLEVDYSEENNLDEVDNNISEDVVPEEPSVAADDNGADELIQELQESLKAQQELEQKVKSLQEKLSVCYTKEARYSTVLSKTKAELSLAKEENKQLAEQLVVANASVQDAKATISLHKEKIQSLQEKLREGRGTHQRLNESLSGKDVEIKTLQGKVTSLQEDLKKRDSEHDVERTKLTEALAESKKDLQIVRSQASSQVVQARQLTEKYKSIAKTAVDKYIRSQALRLGIDAEDIRSKLNENYSFNDIDRVCEGLQKYKLTVNALPFNVGKGNRPVKMAVKESKEVIVPANDDRIDDDIDTTLHNLMQ